MKNQPTFNKYQRNFFFYVFTFLLVFNSFSQEKETSSADSIQKVKSISIENISGETEKLSQRITELRKLLKPSSKIKKIDSSLAIILLRINQKKDSLFAEIETLSSREILSRKVSWMDYESQLTDYQDLLKDRTENISEISDELLDNIKVWEQTKKSILENNITSEISEGIDAILKTLKNTLEDSYARLESVFVTQKKLTEIKLIVDESITEMELLTLERQKSYFEFDQKPIWDTQSDTTQNTANAETISKELGNNKFQNNVKEFRSFIQANTKMIAFQIIFILILIVIMIRVNKKWGKSLEELTNPVEIQTKIVISNPIASSIVSGVLITYFAYDIVNPFFGEISLFIILIGTVLLLPKLTTTKFRLFLILLTVAYVLFLENEYQDFQLLTARWFTIGIAAFSIFTFEIGRKTVLKFPTNFLPLTKLFKAVLPFFSFISFIAIIANIIGMVTLSNYLLSGTIISATLGIVIYLAVKVITSLVILFFKFQKPNNIQALSTIVDATHKRFMPILNWIGIIVWIRFTLGGFDLLNIIQKWASNLMHIHWKVGEMTISLGGIIAFSVIFIITILIAKLVSAIFQDDWMVKVLPRGIAPAISLIFRIVIISIGMYIGLSSAGIDLSNIGFLMGTLGVGIGFGLQNVVLNFVAGLILSFERPINLGDTIEIDQEKGVVTNIGVRSSNIRTYTGAEAIIPNGDLISKKVVNWTLSNRDRRSKIIMKTDPNADPNKVIELFNGIANNHEKTFETPAPKTYFYGYDETGNLSFSLMYWTTFSDTLKTDHEISLIIFETLKKEGLNAPAPIRRIINN